MAESGKFWSQVSCLDFIHCLCHDRINTSTLAKCSAKCDAFRGYKRNIMQFLNWLWNSRCTYGVSDTENVFFSSHLTVLTKQCFVSVLDSLIEILVLAININKLESVNWDVLKTAVIVCRKIEQLSWLSRHYNQRPFSCGRVLPLWCVGLMSHWLQFNFQSSKLGTTPRERFWHSPTRCLTKSYDLSHPDGAARSIVFFRINCLLEFICFTNNQHRYVVFEELPCLNNSNWF